MGSLWCDGLPEEYPHYQEGTFDVDVGQLNCQVFGAYQKTARQNFFIPKSYYKIPAVAANARFVMYSMKGRCRYVIMPCVEILRFYYFGVSGKLGQRLCDGTLLIRPQEVVNMTSGITQKPDVTGHATIDLAKYIDNSDAIEAARLWFDPVAWTQANSMVPRGVTEGSDTGRGGSA